MSDIKKRLPIILPLLGIALLTDALGLLYLYLQGADTVGVWASVSDVLLQLMIILPIFCGIGAAFWLAARLDTARGVKLLSLVLLSCFVYQTVIAFLDYLLFYDYELWAAILFGLLGGLVGGALHDALLLAILFGVPYLIFLRKPSDGSVSYATIAAAVGYLVYQIAERTVDMLLFLSEHFWIANRSEIISLFFYYLFDIALSAAAYGFIRLGIRLAEHRC